MKNTQKTPQEVTSEKKKFAQPEQTPGTKPKNEEENFTGQVKQQNDQTSRNPGKTNPTNKGQDKQYFPEDNDRGYENTESTNAKASRGEDKNEGQNSKPGKNQPDKTGPDKDADKTIPEKSSDPTTSYQTGSSGRKEK